MLKHFHDLVIGFQPVICQSLRAADELLPVQTYPAQEVVIEHNGKVGIAAALAEAPSIAILEGRR